MATNFTLSAVLFVSYSFTRTSFTRYTRRERNNGLIIKLSDIIVSSYDGTGVYRVAERRFR